MSDEEAVKPKRTRKPKAEKPELAAVPPMPENVEGPPPEPPQEVLDGVFVVKRTDPQTGNLMAPQVITNGNLGLLEVESLLKLGLKAFQEQMGFS